MTVARRLVPVVELPRCEAHRSGSYGRWDKWHAHEPEHKRCRLPAHYVVDGAQLCIRHASIAALHYLLGEKK